MVLENVDGIFDSFTWWSIYQIWRRSSDGLDDADDRCMLFLV
jgi:hypothetical protein